LSAPGLPHSVPVGEPGDTGAGFTLLELLAALAVFGFILVILSQATRFGWSALARRDRLSAAGNELNQVDNTIRYLVAHSSPGGTGASPSPFTGTARALTFRTTLPSGLANQRIRTADVTISVDDRHRLRLMWSPWYRNGISQRPPPSTVDLLAGVDHVEFSYWDPGLNLPPGAWVTAWVGLTAPRLVRVRFVFQPGNAEKWPDIIAATERELRVF
jgi:general secretion pathway protein J